MKTKNELNKISNVVIQKKSKGSLKREKVFEDKKINRTKELKRIRKHELKMNPKLRKNEPKKNKKFNRCPSSKKRLNLIELKRNFGSTIGSNQKTILKGKKMESQIIKKKRKKKEKKKNFF